MSKERRTAAGWALTFLGMGLLAAAVTLVALRVAQAWIVPSPCDFTTGGGFVITDYGNHANFGLVGGCKNGGFFGHVNFVYHDAGGEFAGLQRGRYKID